MNKTIRTRISEPEIAETLAGMAVKTAPVRWDHHGNFRQVTISAALPPWAGHLYNREALSLFDIAKITQLVGEHKVEFHANSWGIHVSCDMGSDGDIPLLLGWTSIFTPCEAA